MDSSHQPLVLRSGPLGLVFEEGGLRYIRLGEREIVRRVYCAVRDAQWGTVPNQIGAVRLEQADDSFRLEFDAVCQHGPIDFAWHGSIVGESTGRMVFAMDGVARSTFLKNRLGFCILHPMELAGTAVIVEHPGGVAEHSQFPRYIEWKNPFLEVTGLAHAVAPGVNVRLSFAGDLFETEDQRNWTDASYKTFCTPLARPYPVQVHAGERIEQRVTIELLPLPATSAARTQSANEPAIVTRSASEDVKPAPRMIERSRGRDENTPITLALDSHPTARLPALGFSLAAEGEPLTADELARVRRLRPAHLRSELRLADDFAPALARMADVAKALDCGLDLALSVGPDAEAELRAFVSQVEQLQPRIARWAVFPAAGWATTRELAEIAHRHLKHYDAAIPLGGGTPANFRELNAARPPIDRLDFVTWSVNPQVHAFDDASLVETLAAQGATVESARQFSGGLPLVVGPVTLKMQNNPYASGPWPPPAPPGQLPHEVDPRQASLFGAAWTLGSIKHLAESGAAAATYYELVGWKGLMERTSGSPLPKQFPSTPGMLFPLYYVFAELAPFAGAAVTTVCSSDPLDVEALHVTSGVSSRLFLVNVVGETRYVALPRSADRATIHTLTPAGFVSFAGKTPGPVLSLAPHAVCRVDMMAGA